jgi:hypothetical protein
VPSYFEVARALLAALEENESALAGGVAVGAHGYVRATKDVDIIVGFPLSEALRRLSAHGIEAVLKKGDPIEGDFSCLKGRLEGVPFDVIPQLVPVPWERTISLVLEGKIVRVVDLATLLALKLRAGGARDLLDVAMLVLLHPDHEGAGERVGTRTAARRATRGLPFRSTAEGRGG